MHILYLSTSCSSMKYREVYNIRTLKAIEPQQKFNALIIEGLSKQDNTSVTAISALPVSASTCPKKSFAYEEECVSSSLHYQYLPFRNGKITRALDTYKNSRRLLNQWLARTAGEERYIIADALSLFMTIGCFGIVKKNKVPFVGIVTDLPELSTNMKARKDFILKKIAIHLFQKVTTKSLRMYSAYITLTESLYSEVCPDLSKKYVIIEGCADATIGYNESRKMQNTVVYAGGVYAKYGVKNLVEAFCGLDTDAELHIYGDGSYSQEIIKISVKYPNIKYKGVVSLEEIVRIEETARILVNPRPSNERFSRYSFPSKTIEYMASGTPLLSTKLPGIPQSYFDYIYVIEDESVEGIRNALGALLNEDPQKLIEKGKSAFNFVLGEKTNIKQAKRIIEFLKML